MFEVEKLACMILMARRRRSDTRRDGTAYELTCDFIAGCDGFHGICRPSIPPGVLTHYEREYPFGWLGILADVPPSSEELIYSHHDRGFALLSMRTPHISRLYLQCKPDENIDCGVTREFGRSFRSVWPRTDGNSRKDKSCRRALRACAVSWSNPCNTAGYFLAGDSAHIVPPTGAKGLNLAVADVQILARALKHFYAPEVVTCWIVILRCACGESGRCKGFPGG